MPIPFIYLQVGNPLLTPSWFHTRLYNRIGPCRTTSSRICEAQCEANCVVVWFSRISFEMDRGYKIVWESWWNFHLSVSNYWWRCPWARCQIEYAGPGRNKCPGGGVDLSRRFCHRSEQKTSFVDSLPGLIWKEFWVSIHIEKVFLIARWLSWANYQDVSYFCKHYQIENVCYVKKKQ